MTHILLETMNQRLWPASCNNANEGQTQHFEHSTLRLPTLSPPTRTHLQLSPLCCSACKFYHSFIQTSCWRKAALQSCPLDWSTDCNPRVCCAWLTSKKWPKLSRSCLDKEDTKQIPGPNDDSGIILWYLVILNEGTNGFGPKGCFKFLRILDGGR